MPHLSELHGAATHLAVVAIPLYVIVLLCRRADVGGTALARAEPWVVGAAVAGPGRRDRPAGLGAGADHAAGQSLHHRHGALLARDRADNDRVRRRGLGCASCHGDQALGQRGPDLAGGAELEQFRHVHGSGLFPPAVVTDREFAAVNAWLRTLPRRRG